MSKSFCLSLACLFILGLFLLNWLRVKNQYTNQIGNYWTLSDRASSIPAKSAYLDQFVSALQAAKLGGTHDALILENPENSFDSNLNVLRTLQTRFHEIQKMDVTSFEYQQAMAQITAQEQGEADPMTGTFEGCWYLVHHPLYWEWIFVVVCVVLGLVAIFSAFVWLDSVLG